MTNPNTAELRRLYEGLNLGRLESASTEHLGALGLNKAIALVRAMPGLLDEIERLRIGPDAGERKRWAEAKVESDDRLDVAVDEAARLRAQVKGLVAALRPFALAAGSFGGAWGDDGIITDGVRIADLRRARAAIAAVERSDG